MPLPGNLSSKYCEAHSPLMVSCSARSGARGRYENVETVSEQLLHNKLQIVNSNVGFIHDLAMCNKPPGVILFSVISTILI